MFRIAILSFILVLSFPCNNIAWSQASAIAKPAVKLVQAVGKYLGLTAGKQLDDVVVGLGGKAAVRKLGERAIREGGEATFNSLLKTTRSLGPDVLRAAKNSVNIPKMLKVLNDLPPELGAKGARALAAKGHGKILAETVDKYGSIALKTELRHPGVGGRIVSQLGEEGAVVASKITTNSAIIFSKQASAISKLPAAQSRQMLEMASSYGDRFWTFVGKFIKDNPGKLLFTAAAAPLIYIKRDDIFGGGGEMVVGADGELVWVPKTGIMERVLNKSLSPIIVIVSIGLSLWIGIKVLASYKKSKKKYESWEKKQEN